MIYYGPVSDSKGRVYHYKSVDGETWIRELIGEAEGHGFYYPVAKPLDNVLTNDETLGWLENEPDFTKRIVTPLDSDRDQTKKRQNLFKGSVKLTVANGYSSRCQKSVVSIAWSM